MCMYETIQKYITMIRGVELHFSIHIRQKFTVKFYSSKNSDLLLEVLLKTVGKGAEKTVEELNETDSDLSQDMKI